MRASVPYHSGMDDLFPYLEEGAAVYLKEASNQQGTVVKRLDDEVLIAFEGVKAAYWYRTDEVELSDDE